MYTTPFISPSSGDGHLGHFYLLAIVLSGPTNMHEFVWGVFWDLEGVY